MLTSPDGEILAHTNIELLGSRIEKSLIINQNVLAGHYSQLYNEDAGHMISAISQPVSANEEIRGIAWVGFSQNTLNEIVNETLEKTRRRIIGVATFGLVIGFLGAVLLASMMTKPIKKMAQGAESIGQGKLDTVIRVQTNDELGSLAKDLNIMAKKLAELDQMKQDFVSSITHEFRSPLNAMGIHFDLLFKGHLGELNENQKESLTILKNNASRLAIFIDDLLDIAKIERGKMVINSSYFAIPSIIHETRDFYKVQADKKSIEITTEISDILPNVYADPDRTRQILTNLLNNAIKFTPDNGTIIYTG
jgi:signal transduction histidine kinase